MPFTFQPMPHTEARDRIAKLPLVTREVMDGMLPELRAYAFCITGLDVGDQLSKVRDQIAAVPAGAKTWDKARKEIAAELDSALGGKESQRRAEILLRTHVFRGYAAARYRSLMAQVDVFPFWQYKTHGDGNVRPSHAALNRKIFPAGHEIWQRIFPPWDWGCRCLVVPLTKGAVERMQAGGMAAPANDGSLLPTQISKPEIYTARESDLIATAQKLPDGTPLNHAPTWASAPWSIPGNIRHDWPLIQKRYAHDPEALDAFRSWAGKTEIPDLNMSVADWITHGAARFSQPMRRKSRYGMDVEFDEGEEEKFRKLMTAGGSQTFGRLTPLPAPVASPIAEFESAVAGEQVENAAAWSADGTLRDRRRSAKRSQVSLPSDAVEGGFVSHNHPDGGPPSPGDIMAVMESMPAELRVVTREWIYRVQPGLKATQKFDLLPGYNRQWNAADIISDQLSQSMGWTESQADQAVQHTLLSWLADQGVIHYERLPR